MSDPLVLDFDSTGQNPDNRISGELHLLNNTTGQIFALNYGGFYTASLVIRDPLTNTTLTPIVDYVVVGPYDNITKQTGLEAGCVIVMKIATWQREWEVSYSAVGGEYSTNVQAIRDIIALQTVEINAVRWGDIVNKPTGFQSAPHLYDFRKDIFGFEGLIESIDRVAERMAPLSPSESSVLLTQFQASINALANAVNQTLADLQQQVDGINVPDTSSFIQGGYADASDIQNGIAANKVLAAANIPTLLKRARMSKQLSSAQSPTIFDGATDPVVTGDFNFRPFGDGSVPNASLTYIVETMWWRIELTDPNAKRGFQIATCISNDPVHYGTVLYRARYTGATAPGLWTRVDVNKLKNVPNLAIAIQSQRAWASAADNALMTPLQTQLLLQENSDYIVPVASVVAYAGETMDWTNSNYMFCQNQLLSTTAYPTLFARIGYKYGGTGTTFRLPDLRGVAIRGFDAGRGLDPGRVFGSYQEDQNKLHGHPFRTGGDNTGGTNTNGGLAMEANGANQVSHNEFTDAPTSTRGEQIGGSGGDEARMKNVAMHFIIRVR